MIDLDKLRRDYPDLTPEEESAIKAHIDRGECLFLRCKFESSPYGYQIDAKVEGK